MPRITANSVEEHRAMQHRALLDAARAIIVDDAGIGSFTFGRLAEMTGLARSSIYEYFPNKDSVVLALLDEEFPAWQADLERALRQADTPRGAVVVFVEAQIRMAAAGRHDLAYALMSGQLDNATKAQLGARHAEIIAVLDPFVREMGVSEPSAALQLAGAVVASGIERVRAGEPPERVAREAAEFAAGGVAALARQS